jgi:hypothetical protein
MLTGATNRLRRPPPVRIGRGTMGWAALNVAVRILRDIPAALGPRQGQDRPVALSSSTPEDLPVWRKKEKGGPNLGFHGPDLGLWS